MASIALAIVLFVGIVLTAGIKPLFWLDDWLVARADARKLRNKSEGK